MKANNVLIPADPITKKGKVLRFPVERARKSTKPFTPNTVHIPVVGDINTSNREVVIVNELRNAVTETKKKLIDQLLNELVSDMQVRCKMHDVDFETSNGWPTARSMALFLDSGRALFARHLNLVHGLHKLADRLYPQIDGPNNTPPYEPRAA